MARYITLLLLIATCYAQESSDAWLNITLEEDKTPQKNVDFKGPTFLIDSAFDLTPTH